MIRILTLIFCLFTAKALCQDLQKSVIKGNSLKRVEGFEGRELRIVREYDRNGNPITLEDIKLNFGISQKTSYEYKDTLLVGRVWKHSNINEESSWGYRYDAKGCLVEIFSRGAKRQRPVFTFKNDESCRKVIETSYDDNGNVAMANTYEYDSNGNVVKTQVEMKQYGISRASYDRFNSVNLKVEGELVEGRDTTLSYNFIYDSKGNLVEKIYRDREKQTYGSRMTYNEKGQLLQEAHTDTDGQLVWTKTYRYSEDGLPHSFHEKYLRNASRDIEIVFRYETWE